MNERTQYFLAEHVAPWLVRGLAGTIRIQLVGEEHLERARGENGRVLMACLHGRMFIPVWVHGSEGVTTLVSQSRDGEVVARLVHKLGHKTVRGSSHRGAFEGLREMIKVGKESTIAMMVDGPRGPREEPKMGTIALARLTGLPIVPLLGSAKSHWEFGSWDRFQLPKPFSRGIVGYGEGLIVPRSAKGEEAMEEYRVELQHRLLALKDRIDRVASGEEIA